MATYDVIRTIDDGIERIVYKPHEPKFQTPVVMQHGMWHGAWCWETWQRTLAELGWETHAHSLPGHGESPVQRPIRWCTLPYYLRFFAAEVGRHGRRPVLIGHSMGGALIQWYLKRVADDLPAAVLVASWNSHEMQSATLYASTRDVVGFLLSVLSLSATPFMRSPRSAARVLISDAAICTPEELHARVGPESAWVLLNHNLLTWHPKRDLQTPRLWLIPGADGAVPPMTQERSARFYQAEVIHVPGAGHNLMMEHDHEQLAHQIHDWLVGQGIS
jgi:pimeloyl-ACP methyl ester carboxylesterase